MTKSPISLGEKKNMDAKAERLDSAQRTTEFCL